MEETSCLVFEQGEVTSFFVDFFLHHFFCFILKTHIYQSLVIQQNYLPTRGKTAYFPCFHFRCTQQIWNQHKKTPPKQRNECYFYFESHFIDLKGNQLKKIASFSRHTCIIYLADLKHIYTGRMNNSFNKERTLINVQLDFERAWKLWEDAFCRIQLLYSFTYR